MGGKKVKFYLSAEYATKLELLVRITGKSKSALIREAIDLLIDKYIGGKQGGGRQ